MRNSLIGDNHLVRRYHLCNAGKLLPVDFADAIHILRPVSFVLLNYYSSALERMASLFHHSATLPSSCRQTGFLQRCGS